MRLKLLTLLFYLLLTLMASAQASGGQIMRPAKRQSSNATNRTVKPSKIVKSQSPYTLTGNAPSQVAVGEQFKLSYTVNAAEDKSFCAGNFPDALEVLIGPNRRVNVHTSDSTSIIYTFIIVATKKGSYTIPAAHVSVGGKTVTSNKLHIKVSEQAVGL